MKKQITHLSKYITALALLFSTTFVYSQSYSGGAGTVANPYNIANKVDLKYLSEHSVEWTKSFSQTKNISFSTADFASGGDFYNSNKGFTPIGNNTNNFSGSYNGNAFSIYGLTINSSGSYVGLFGYNSSSAILSSVYLQACNIASLSDAGCLVGHNEGSISNSYSTGSVNGLFDIGGLVGYNTGTISNSYSSAAATISNNSCGGLVGFNAGPVTNSYSTGLVSGSGNHFGGLIGYNIGTTTNSYWNTESSGQPTSAAGTGKTTAEMKTQSTFSGWDFVGETINGTTDIWKMDNVGCFGNYPIFAIQNTALPAIVSTTGANFCTAASATLTAELSQSSHITLWYANASGGTSIGSDISFTTLPLTTTTSYWAESKNGSCTTNSRTEAIAALTTCTAVIQNQSTGILLLYPNPTKGNLRISSSNDIAKIEVYNSQGLLLLVKTVSLEEIDLSSFQAGMYVVRITDTIGSVTSTRIEHLN
jgi:hypothetical protein